MAKLFTFEKSLPPYTQAIKKINTWCDQFKDNHVVYLPYLIYLNLHDNFDLRVYDSENIDLTTLRNILVSKLQFDEALYHKLKLYEDIPLTDVSDLQLELVMLACKRTENIPESLRKYFDIISVLEYILTHLPKYITIHDSDETYIEVASKEHLIRVIIEMLYNGTTECVPFKLVEEPADEA